MNVVKSLNRLGSNSLQLVIAILYTRIVIRCNRVDNAHPDTLVRPFHLRPVTATPHCISDVPEDFLNVSVVSSLSATQTGVLQFVSLGDHASSSVKKTQKVSQQICLEHLHTQDFQ